MTSSPTTCTFEHPGIAALGRPVFRLSQGDGLAAMAVIHDSGDMVIPLRVVTQAFDIRSDSADAHMLQLIEQALRFVCLIELGGELPREVLTGEASWTPSAYHVQLASARLQIQLVGSISGMEGAHGERLTPEMLLASVDDPAMRPRVQEALRKIASELQIEGGGSAVAVLVEELAGELAYIEALRARLLEPVKAVTKRVYQIGKELSVLAPSRRETFSQVSRLAAKAVKQIVGWFEEVDAEMSEILPALRNLNQKKSFLRPHRDRLYCVLLAWEPLLRAWDKLPVNTAREPDGLWRVIDEMYQFLAPRYMSVQEWQTTVTALAKLNHGTARIIW